MIFLEKNFCTSFIQSTWIVVFTELWATDVTIFLHFYSNLFKWHERAKLKASFQFVSIYFFSWQFMSSSRTIEITMEMVIIIFECCALVLKNKGHVPEISEHRKRYIIFFSPESFWLHLPLRLFIQFIFNLIDIIELFVSCMYCGFTAHGHTMSQQNL